MDVEMAGHNFTNVNNPAYARQRVQLQTGVAVRTMIGSEGAGSRGVWMLCELLAGSLRSGALDLDGREETAISRAFLDWYRKLISFQAREAAESVNGTNRGFAAGAANRGSSLASGDFGGEIT